MLVQTDYQFQAAIDVLSQAELIGFDTEGDSIPSHDGGRLSGISVCTVVETKLGPTEFAFYFPFRHATQSETLFRMDDAFTPGGPAINLPMSYLVSLKELFSNEEIVFAAHHIKHDASFLRADGIEIPGPFYDTMVFGNMINENERLSLNYMCDTILGWNMSPKKSAMRKLFKEVGAPAIAADSIHDYAVDDARGTYYLVEPLKNALIAQGQWDLWPKEEEFIRVLLELEWRGIQIDIEGAKKLQEQSLARLADIELELHFKPSENRQVARVLFKELGLPYDPEDHTKDKSPDFPMGLPRQDEKTLLRARHHYNGPNTERLDHILDLVLEYRAVTKANSTWYSAFISNADPVGRIHPRFNFQESDLKQDKAERYGATTTRMTAKGSGVHQLPRAPERAVRRLIVASEGYGLGSFDYKAVELRFAAVYADCKPLMETFFYGGDPHQTTADGLGIDRDLAKNCNFLCTYLGGAERMTETYGIPLDQSEQFVEGFHALYPEFKRKAREVENAIRKNGYVKLWTGRRRHFSPDRPWEFHKGWNALIQGGASEILRESMRRLYREEMEEQCKLFFTVMPIHDALLIELKEEMAEELAQEIAREMEWPSREPIFKLPFPVEYKRVA